SAGSAQSASTASVGTNRAFFMQISFTTANAVARRRSCHGVATKPLARDAMRRFAVTPHPGVDDPSCKGEAPLEMVNDSTHHKWRVDVWQLRLQRRREGIPDFTLPVHGRVRALAAEPGAAPDRGRITAFRGILSPQRPRQVSLVVRYHVVGKVSGV